jgi:hypothetical protein
MQASSRRMVLTGALAATAGTALAQPYGPGMAEAQGWVTDLGWDV